MPRKVILDVDPGIDDALALAMALFDPRLEVVAVTAVAGNVSAQQATRNVQAIIEQLDPPRWPRIGVAVEPEHQRPVDRYDLFGADGLGNADFQVAELHNLHPSDKVLADEIRSAPEEITILALGPLTNVACALRRDPSLAGLIGQLIIRGGSIAAPGDITPAAEFNTYFDPQAARDVFHSRTTKTLVPLDVVQQVILTYNHFDQLPNKESPLGKLLHAILPHAYRAYRQVLGLEGILVNETVAVVALTNPELFTTERMGGDVEIGGELCRGATIFDRRRVPAWRPNMDVATELHTAAVVDAILRGLGGQH